MRIICALDVHRKQITYKWLDTESGEVKRGHITPVTREEVRGWLSRFQGLDAHVALEAPTGWRSRGHRPTTYWSYGPASGSARPWWTSVGNGSNASRPNSSTKVCLGGSVSPPPQAVPPWPTPCSHRPAERWSSAACG